MSSRGRGRQRSPGDQQQQHPLTCTAPSPPLNTTKLCRIKSFSRWLPLDISANCLISASAALPLYNLGKGTKQVQPAKFAVPFS